MSAPLLSVSDLHVSFATEEGTVKAVDGVSFDLNAGEILAIVGESGSGKSVTALTVMGLSRGPNARIDGSVRLGEQDILTLDEDALRSIRGEQIAMVFQDPMTALNPVYKVGDQIVEQILAHEDVSKQEARERAVEALRSVGIPNPERRFDNYPHEFSGGMRQRAMIALALVTGPGHPDRRRAHHGARRDDPGADPAAADEAEQRAQPVGDPDHARPRAWSPRWPIARS